jgi:hypothetical protein
MDESNYHTKVVLLVVCGLRIIRSPSALFPLYSSPSFPSVFCRPFKQITLGYRSSPLASPHTIVRLPVNLFLHQEGPGIMTRHLSTPRLGGQLGLRSMRTRGFSQSRWGRMS